MFPGQADMVVKETPEKFRIGMVIHGADCVEQAPVVPIDPVLPLEDGGPEPPDGRSGDIGAVQIIGAGSHGEFETVPGDQRPHGGHGLPDIFIAEGEDLVLDRGFAEHGRGRHGTIEIPRIKSPAGIALTGIVHQQQGIVVADEIEMDRLDPSGEPVGQNFGGGKEFRAVAGVIAADSGETDAEAFFHFQKVFFRERAADRTAMPACLAARQ